MARAALRGEELAAPDLIDVETVSVLRKRWRAEDLTTRRFRRSIDDLATLPVTRYPTRPLMQRAFGLRDNVTPYVGAYVGLAEALDCPSLTGDARLARAPGPRCEVRLLRP